MIVIVDYGVGNPASILNMLRHIGAPAQLSADREAIARATKLILPGVGAFDAGMRRLRGSGLIDVLADVVLERGTPLLGVCLGMQLLTRTSEEGSEQGLGWVDARTVRFRQPSAAAPLRIPHMGWNVLQTARRHPLVDALANDARFYFVHSFHVECGTPEDVVATAIHGYAFPAVIASGGICGTQFHPEKSHRHGMALLQAFAASA